MTYEERKEARRAAYIARHGKTQPKKSFKVYAVCNLGLIPTRFETTPIGAFSARKDAEEFVRDSGPGTGWGSKAEKALGQMMTHEEHTQTMIGSSNYVRFEIRSEEVL